MPWLGPDMPLFDAGDAAALVPYQGASASSQQGAQVVQLKAGSQAAQLLALYQTQGPLSDHQVEALLGWPLARICARRGALVKQKRVEKAGTRPGPCPGVSNTTWRVRV